MTFKMKINDKRGMVLPVYGPQLYGITCVYGPQLYGITCVYGLLLGDHLLQKGLDAVEIAVESSSHGHLLVVHSLDLLLQRRDGLLEVPHADQLATGEGLLEGGL